MTWEGSAWCTECDWEYEVEGKISESDVSIALAAKSAAHVSTSDCPYGSTDYEVEENV